MLDKDKGEEAIFKAAVKLKTPAERKAYVEDACGNDSKLLARVTSLLDVSGGKNSILDILIAEPDVTMDDLPVSEGPGTVIGRYKLLEKIGEGGMAVVYMAEQEKPIRRKVALKIIKLGMDTKSVIARFEAERQALAIMDHPNIAKVLDAGATETGRPYFVMELVTGVSITEYCDKNNLSTKGRLALFIQVCNAVQHAHQKSIIHRDIKPTNVMVAHHDGKPVPKVIDFGIAKATNQRLTEKTLFTRYAHIIGTPAYMSPEQAELSDLGIDGRTDIYSLGVLLYELLTGTPPFSEEVLRKAGYLEMQRIIREQEPTKPSTKLSTLGETLTDIAKRRGCTPDLLTKTVRGDLDWIAMKSLEKDRVRRYEAAEGLALDVQRYLENRPVMAHAPSTSYRLKKFLRRNRLHVGAALALVIVVAAAIILSVWNQHQVRAAKTQGMRQAKILPEARRLVTEANFTEALQILGPILESGDMGFEARVLFARITGGDHNHQETAEIQAVMNKHYLERVSYYTKKIQTDPTDPNNYLQRAQQYHYLNEGAKARADMDVYKTLLNPPKGTAAYDERLRALSTQEAHSEILFGEPSNLGPPINTPYDDGGPCISADGLTLYFSSNRPGNQGVWGIWFATRATTSDPWTEPANLGPPINTSDGTAAPRLSADGLELYFTSSRPGGRGGNDIWVSTRASTSNPWGEPLNLGPNVNSSAWEARLSISTDGLSLYFGSNRDKIGTPYSTLCYIYMTTRPTTNDPWGVPVRLGPAVNTGLEYDSTWPLISADDQVLFFGSDRPVGVGRWDVWLARRSVVDGEWGTAVNLGPPINTSYNDIRIDISTDGLMLYFVSDRPGGFGGRDIWQVSVGGKAESTKQADSLSRARQNDDGREVEP